MAFFQKNELLTNKQFIHKYENTEQADLLRKANSLFNGQGYRRLEGNAQGAVYTKGNRFVRLILGAFHKYHKFRLEVKDNQIAVTRETTGISGGLFGISQVKKETKRLAELFESI